MNTTQADKVWFLLNRIPDTLYEKIVIKRSAEILVSCINGVQQPDIHYPPGICVCFEYLIMNNGKPETVSQECIVDIDGNFYVENESEPKRFGGIGRHKVIPEQAVAQTKEILELTRKKYPPVK